MIRQDDKQKDQQDDQLQQEQKQLRSVALQNAQSILLARRRAEEELRRAKSNLELKNVELAQQKEWFEVTLSSIGDAVITTDTQGRVTFMNPVAEAVTGVTVTDRLMRDVEIFSAKLAGRFEIPVFLYEKSERGRHEADLPSLRHGGFGSLLDQELRPDFGPGRVHPRLGLSIVGVRDFLVALKVNFAGEDANAAKDMSREIRSMRASGDHRFL